MRAGRGALAVIAVAVTAMLPATAHATLPGANGKIAFEHYSSTSIDRGIWVMNSDGSNRVQLTTNPNGGDLAPAWSPDGQQIAFVRERGIWVMNANGSGQHQVVPAPTETNDCGFPPCRKLGSPAWSPDGTKLVYDTYHQYFVETTNEDYALHTVNVDGTGDTLVTDQGRGARWSPDGTKIGYTTWCFGGGCTDAGWITPDGSTRHQFPSVTDSDGFIDWSPDASLLLAYDDFHATAYTIHPDGTGRTDLSGFSGRWSPDGKKFIAGGGPANSDIYTANTDGTGVTNLTNNGNNGQYDRTPDWQPIPVNYARPRGASPFLTYLVPAYNACTAANRTHGSPLAFPACAPPTQTSSSLTLGTPDANGHAAATIGSVRYRTVVGNPSTPANEADLRIDVSVTGVLKSDLTPYGGELSADAGLRITDRSNTPNPGGPGPGTLEDTSFPVTVPCAAGICSVSTTANALAPGAVLEGRRAIWQLGQVKVYDGGADGVASTTGDNTLFMVEGVFVP